LEEPDWHGPSEDARVSAEGLGNKGEKRKTQRPLRAQESEVNLVLGMEVSIDETLEMAECTLVGRARGKKFSSGFLQSWGEQQFVCDRPLGFEALALAKDGSCSNSGKRRQRSGFSVEIGL